jgi:hypothetical protein
LGYFHVFIALLSNFTMHSDFSSLARQHLARQPCPGSLDRQFDQFRPDLMRALARSAVTALYYSGRSPNYMRALLS